MKLAKIDFFAPSVKEVISQSPNKKISKEIGRMLVRKEEDRKYTGKNKEHLNLNIFKLEKK